MAYGIKVTNADKEIQFNELFGLPYNELIDYGKFIGIKDKVIVPINLSDKILGQTVGLEGEVRLTAGLDLQSRLTLGSAHLDFPWESGGVAIQLVGNEQTGYQLALKSNFDPNNILPTIDINPPAFKIYSGLELGLGGYLNGRLGSKSFSIIPLIKTSDANIKYKIFAIDEGTFKGEENSSASDFQSLSTTKGREIDLPGGLEEAGFKLLLSYPETTEEVLKTFETTVSKTGISIKSEVPIITLEGDIIRLLSNIPYLELLEIVSGRKTYGGYVTLDWRFITATLNAGLNFKFDTGITFGDLVGTLTFEDGTSQKFPLVSGLDLPKIDLGANPLAKLNKIADDSANITLTIGFDSPQIQPSNAGFYADIYAGLIVGEFAAELDVAGVVGSFKPPPVYTDRYDISKNLIWGKELTKSETISSSLAPTLSFTISIPISSPTPEFPDPLARLKSDAVLNLVVPSDSVPIVEILEGQGNTILAKKLEGNIYTYVLYKISDLSPSDNPIDPYKRSDLLNKAIILRDRSGTIITEPKDTLDRTPYLGEYRPIGAEENSSGIYTVVLSKLLPPFQSGDSQPFIVWDGRKVTEGDKAYMSAETNQYTNANQIARYEVALQQDLNQTGYVEYGELISGNLIGNGLWYDGSGYWIGRAQEKPSSYLVDPTKTFNLPGTPIKLVSPADNIENSQYQGVLFKQGINEFYLWSIDQNNRKVSSAIANGGISNPGILDESSLAHYERLFNEDFNQDGFKGLVKIIDSNSGKDDYTTLGEFIEPQDFDPHTRVSYFVRDPQLKVNTTYKYNNNESPFGPVKGYSVPSFILKSIRNTPIGYYKYDDGSEFNTSSSMPGQGWRAIAASFIPTETKIVKATFGTVEVPLFGEITVISEGFVDVMWKSPDENNPRWFIWRFEMAAPNNYYSPSSTTTFGNDIFYQPPILDAEAADTTDNNKAEYLNTISEVAVYESQFSEDFNQDGFIGTTTLLEQKGDVTLALVGYTPKPIFDDSSIIQPETLFTYQLKETTQSRGKNITINVRGGTITSSSSWQPLAAERYLINGPELEKGAYFSVLGKNTNTNTYSIFLLDEFANKMNDVPEQVISGADISIYEAQFQQDFNQDGAIYQHKIVDSEGAVLLGSSQNGYVIDELAKKQYLKLNNGSVLTEAVASDSGNVPFLIDKIATGYALLQKGTNGATYQRAKVDSTGKITDTRAIFFEPYRYIASNPDLIVAFATNTIAAQDHYLRAGYLEDRSTTGFDGLRYLASNPDLIFAGLRDERNGETHWINHGFYEGRSTSSFDAIQYLASYGDLIADYGYNLTQAIVHYINYGIFEGRSTDGFNEARYLASNPDLVRAGILGATDAANHWINDGFREGRALNRFNEADYLASYDDLLSSFGTNSDAAFGHWLSNGIQEGRTITFNPARYIASYPDLIQAFGYDLDAGRQHYISIGQSETRGRGIFDPESYLFFNSDLKELFVNDLESATKHYINFGWQEGRKW